MSRSRSHETVLPSLLDRLVDEEPERELESVRSPAARLQALRAGVRRDLENLLNTRIVRSVPLDTYPELATSVVHYGLPDFSAVVLGAPEEREAFRARVQRTIARYEPRFRQTRVETVPTGDEADRTLHLKITATLLVEPDPVPLRYESQMHATDRLVRLKEVRDG